MTASSKRRLRGIGKDETQNAPKNDVHKVVQYQHCRHNGDWGLMYGDLKYFSKLSKANKKAYKKDSNMKGVC